MKKINLFYLLSAILFGAMLMVSSCTKEGPAGKDGQDGEDGIDGQDGTASCIQCHDDSQVIFAKSIQWESSVHATGGNFERNTEDCAPCHTSQGFLERIANGSQTSSVIDNPNPPNCYTCHNIHDSYTPDDWDLSTTAAVDLWINGVSTDQGKANVCVECHQSMVPDPMPIPGSKEDITIGSPYWGPHHGPQGAVMAGSGGYEVGGGYTNSMHSTMVENTCITCHLATAYGIQAGGHNMGMTYAYHGHDVVNNAGCIACHTDPDALETKIEETNTAIDGLLGDLRSILLTQGVLDSSDHVIPGTMEMDQAGGVFNYLYVLEDRSGGVHNSKYSEKLLENSIESLE
jgi:hypothetical protein